MDRTDPPTGDAAAPAGERAATSAPLPTRDQMLDAGARELDVALKALGDAGDWLRSDWQPVGTSLTPAQQSARDRMWKAIDVAKAAIDKADRWRR